MTLEDSDLAQLRAHVDRIVPMLRGEPKVVRASQIAKNLATSFDSGFGLLAVAQAIPAPRLVGRVPGPIEPLGTSETDNAIEKFIQAVEDALAELADFQSRTSANRSLSRDDVRALVLRDAEILDKEKGGHYIWMDDIQWRVGLTEYQIMDAVEYWHDRGALRSDAPQIFQGGKKSWLFWLTHDGRDMATKGPVAERAAEAGIIIARHVTLQANYAPGNVQQTGDQNVASVQQRITIDQRTTVLDAAKSIGERLNEFPDEDREDVAEQLAIIEEEGKSPAPRLGRVKAAFSTVKRVVGPQAGTALSTAIEAAVKAGIGAITGVS